MLKNLTKKFRKDSKGAPIVEMVIIFPVAIMLVVGAISFAWYIAVAVQMNSITNDVAETVSEQMRGEQGGLGLASVSHQAYIIDRVVDQIASSKLPKAATIFVVGEGNEKRKVTEEEVRNLLLIEDEEGCDAKMLASEEVICVYTDTTSAAVTGAAKETVQVRMYSKYDLFTGIFNLNGSFSPIASKPLDLGTPNTSF